MKKIEYLTPEVKVIVMKSKSAVLVGSGETAPSTGDSEEL